MDSVHRLKQSLPLTTANAIIQAALETGRSHDMLPLTVVVLDSGGRMVAMQSEDGSGIMRLEVAFGKAWGALGMGISSRLIRDRLSARPTFVNALAAASEGRMIPVPGGVMVLDAEGAGIGAVGISGDTSEKDEFCAIAGIHAAGLASEPAEPDPNWQGSSLSDHDS